MKSSQIKNILVLFVLSVILHGEVQGNSFQEENKTERQGGYIRQRILSHCPYTVGTPCWGVQVCRGGKPVCVSPINVFNTDVCGDCKTNTHPQDKSSESPEEYTGDQETGNGIITGNKGDSNPTVYNPNAARCPRSETYPCYGIPVCRMESGQGINFCVQPDSVFQTDKCGYCDDNGGTYKQETNGGGNDTNSQNKADDGTKSTGDQETGNGIIKGNDGDSNPTGNIRNDKQETNGGGNGANSQNKPNDGNESTGDQETGNGIITRNYGDLNPTGNIPNAAKCPRSETYPCYGIPVCRIEDGEGVNFCVQPDSVFPTDKCGYCDDIGSAGNQEHDGVGNATSQDIASQVDPKIDGIIKKNKGKSKPAVYIPNAANCRHSDTSPCFGIPVCRTINGVPVNRCMEAGHVLKSDKCGYCDDEK